MLLILKSPLTNLINQINRLPGRPVQFIQNFGFTQHNIRKTQQRHIVTCIVIIAQSILILIFLCISSPQLYQFLSHTLRCFPFLIDGTCFLYTFRYGVIDILRFIYIGESRYHQYSISFILPIELPGQFQRDTEQIPAAIIIPRSKIHSDIRRTSRPGRIGMNRKNQLIVILAIFVIGIKNIPNTGL